MVSALPMLKRFLGLSLALHLFITLPATVLIVFSDAVHLACYEAVAGRIGSPKIVLIGDSITRDGGLWGFRLHRPWLTVRNLGHSALYTEQMLYQAHWAVELGAETAFIMAGINDPHSDRAQVDESFQAYVEILETLRDGRVQPVIQSTLYRANGEDETYITALNEKLQTYARHEHIPFLDLNRLLCEGHRLKKQHSRDGTYLTDEAYRIWSAALREWLKHPTNDGPSL